MIINNNALNSMPQQVEENKNNIKLLAQYLKEAYNTSLDLGDSAVSIAISDTNATADTIDGWLITNDGYLYKITSGDGTNLLLEYYTRLKGKNASDDIDDNTTSATKLWSSQKTSNEIINTKNLIDKGSYITYTSPTPIDSTYYSLNKSDIDNINNEINPTNEDLIFYIDSSNKAKEIYKIYSHDDDFTSFTLVKVAEFGGKEIYQHNLRWGDSGSGNNSYGVSIFNNSPTPFTFSALLSWLSQHGYVQTTASDTQHVLVGSGKMTYGGTPYDFVGLIKMLNDNFIGRVMGGYGSIAWMSSLPVDYYEDNVIQIV